MSEEVIVTSEFVTNAKRLYRASLRYTKARIAHASTWKKEDWEEVSRRFQLLRKALTCFNYGVDPLKEGGAK